MSQAHVQLLIRAEEVSAGLKETLYDPVQLADYLLYRLNLRYFNPDYSTRPEDLRTSPFVVRVIITSDKATPYHSQLSSAFPGSPTDKRHRPSLASDRYPRWRLT